jgi:hypothetical protein
MAKESALTIGADPALIYEILTDHENLGQWLPYVSESRLLASEGDLALAELNLSDGENTRCAMECVHNPGRMVVWQPLGDQVPVTRFEWTIETSSNGGCLVSAAAEKPLSFARWSGTVDKFLEPASCLNALKDQAALFGADDFLSEGCEKLLEIVETSSGLVCWLRGKKYRLVPEKE